MSGTSAPGRWSATKRLKYSKRLLAGMQEGAQTGVRFVPVFLTRQHVMENFEIALAPVKIEDGSDVGGYGFTPQNFGAPEGMSIEHALEYVEEIWNGYCCAAWPMHSQTPGSPKWEEDEEAGNPHESLADFWHGWTGGQ